MCDSHTSPETSGQQAANFDGKSRHRTTPSFCERIGGKEYLRQTQRKLVSVFIQTPREENAIQNLVVLEKMASDASNVAEAIGETRRAATISLVSPPIGYAQLGNVIKLKEQ